MGVAILDGSTLRSVVGDEVAFNRSIYERLAVLELNGGGVLSGAPESFRLLKPHFGLDRRLLQLHPGFLVDIDRDELRSRIRKHPSRHRRLPDPGHPGGARTWTQAPAAGGRSRGLADRRCFPFLDGAF
ncbi:hypothetical protein ZIOFF_065987 [Zingiber officinale]|uniref:Uncharacterized protein n=2 Tax=Zingiber officinale TaxID=94328 RepID=A0A8J5EY45_ZINOF|nr:hypothetical protein ZIOFF_065987 [Zingiber officinale]